MTRQMQTRTAVAARSELSDRRRPDCGCTAVRLALLLFVASIGLGLLLSWQFGVVAAAYAVLMAAYTFQLKHLVTHRRVRHRGRVRPARGRGRAGDPRDRSRPGCILCTLLLALFLGLRQAPPTSCGCWKTGASATAETWSEYTPALLDAPDGILPAPS